MTAQFTAHVTRHGLGLGQYGELVLVCEDKKAGLVLWLQTETRRLEVRLTPGGMIRLGEPKRREQR